MTKLDSPPGFFQHVLRVALALGLVLGLILFSALLYVSDFGENPDASRPSIPAAATPVESAPEPDATEADLARRGLEWLFGPVQP
jgi:hypothetical protein